MLHAMQRLVFDAVLFTFFIETKMLAISVTDNRWGKLNVARKLRESHYPNLYIILYAIVISIPVIRKPSMRPNTVTTTNVLLTGAMFLLNGFKHFVLSTSTSAIDAVGSG
ncbi:hypothetical protein DRO31_07750 [Candidatus Bathyarchaeota archaeon]|nr:MAG: hypothetical protein DRO31_07750 [Candidatus Bathyarchaeota archaeon]